MPNETTVQQAKETLKQLLPPGRALTRAIGSGLDGLLEGLAVEFARVEETLDTLYTNFDPSQASELLDEWEEALGLPTECNPSPSTVEADRQAALMAKIRGRGDHSSTLANSIIETLGYTDDVEYSKLYSFQAGSSAGSQCWSDEFANYVRIEIETADQTADNELTCLLQDLVRAHGYLELVLAGPMGASRTFSTNYLLNNNLSASITEASISGVIELKYQGFLSVQCILNNGTAGVAPTSAPIGTWKLYSSTDGVTFSELTAAAVATEFSGINPVGNTAISGYATFQNVPGRYAKVAYTRTSGGGSGASCTLHLTTW